jgi:eukaryotic-like serine/threonine-protein kinase
MTASRPGSEVIFHAARDIPDPDRRREYIREACGGHQAWIDDVEALLAAADSPDSLLDHPAADALSATIGPPAIDRPTTESPGTLIGPYKLIEPIGEGGMGSVWMAQQTEPVKRLVALKLIKAGMDSRQVIARFEAERQALALMDHPNIARVLEGGTTGGGRPFFVMDLVKGMPITRYCDEHRLTPRQRLELFIPVCQAVQHAHQKGIIHRDLKPSNVLVALYDGRPVPKVIDFGVAKAAGPQLTDKTLVTGFGAIVGTLEYMSPEQAEVNQLDIDTRSDIYSLGVLLYELLTGSPPFSRKELAQAGMLEMLRVIREQEPTKPSTKLSTAEGLPTLAANRGTEPARLTRLVRGELDWIVMKALEKDRNRRYETANGLAMDLRRYLADEPVQAGPPSAWYRFRKFARRHRAALSTTALVAVLLVVGTAVSWYFAIQARERAKEATANAATAKANERQAIANANAANAQKAIAKERAALAIEAIETFSKTVSSDPILQAPQFEGLRRSLLKTPLEFFKRLSGTLESGAGAGTGTDADADAETRAGLAASYAALAALTYEIGSYEDALRASTESRDLLRRLADQRPNEPEHRLQLARTLNLIGRILSRKVEQRREGIRSYEDAAQILEGLVRATPDDPSPRTDLAATYTVMGSKERDAGLYQSARQHFGRSRELFEDLARRQPAVPAHRQGLARVFNGLAILERITDEPTPGAKRMTAVFDAINRSCALWEALTREFPDSAEYRAGLARAVNSRAVTIRQDGRLPEAIADFEWARSLHRSLVERFGAVTDYREELGRTCINLGRTYSLAGRPDDSARRFTEARDLYDGLARENPTAEAFRMEMANACESLGRLDLAAGRADQAVASLQRGRELLEGLAREERGFGWYHYLLTTNLFALCRAQRASSRPRESPETYRRVVALLEESEKPNSVANATISDLAEWQNDLARFLATDPDPKLLGPARAVALDRKAVALARKATAARPRVSYYWYTLGMALYRAGDWPEAIEALRKSNELGAKEGLGFNGYFLAMAHHRRGETLPARIWFDVAGRWHHRALPTHEGLKRFRAEAADLLGLDAGSDRMEKHSPSDDASLAELVLQADPAAAWARDWAGHSSTLGNHSPGPPADAVFPNGPEAFARP